MFMQKKESHLGGGGIAQPAESICEKICKAEKSDKFASIVPEDNLQFYFRKLGRGKKPGDFMQVCKNVIENEQFFNE
jgi:hypothetical protein